MKTILIYDQLDSSLKFRVVDGDYSHLNNLYINDEDTTNEQADEITALTLYPEGHEKEWRELDDFQETFPVEVFKENDPDQVKVVVVGFLP